MATVQREFVEKPPHIDERRMRHISDADLFAALDLARPGLDEIREAAGRGDWDGAYSAWSAYFAERDRPVPAVNTAGYGRFLREHDADRAAATIAEATALHTIAVDYTDRTMGKSRLYGFHYFGWLAPLIDAYAIDGDERHAAAFARLFNQWYETRDDVHGEWQMDVIWYSLGLSIRTPIFALAYRTFRHSPSLDGRTQARLLKTVLGAARWLAEEHDAFRYGNWQHHGITGLFDLATFWPEFKEAPAWAELAWDRLLEHLELDVYPDGGHFERAPTYHTGVMSGYRRVADAAELNWHARLQDHPRFHAMYRCLLEQCTPLGTSLNFNDSGIAGVVPHMVQGAVLFADPEFKWLAEHLGTPLETAATLAALPDRADGRTVAQAYADLPSRSPSFSSTLLPTSKFAIMRGGWERDDLFLAINYGPYVEHELESHSHFDALSFTAAGFGEPLAIEAGKPINYDDPLYYDWYRVARAHNVVTVDGADPEPERKDGDLLIWSTSPVADLFQARHDGYLPAKGVGHRRTILFVRTSYFVVHDELDQDGRTSHEFAWHLHMPGEFDLVDGAVRPESGPGLLAMPVSPGEEQRAEMVEGTMVVPQFAPNEGSDDRRAVRGVRYVQDSAARQVTFFTVLAPVRQEAEAANIAVTAVPMNGGDGEACAIATPEGEDLVAIAGGSEAGVRRAGAWSSDGRAWLVRSSGAWAAYALSELHRDDTTIFRSTFPVESVAVWPADGGWAGEIVALRKTGVRFRIGTVSRVTLNGVVVPREGAGDDAAFDLPAAGRYTFALGR